MLGDCSYMGVEFIAINVQLQLYNLCRMIMWPCRLLWVVAIAAVMAKQVLQRFSQEPFMKGSHVRDRSASCWNYCPSCKLHCLVKPYFLPCPVQFLKRPETAGPSVE